MWAVIDDEALVRQRSISEIRREGGIGELSIGESLPRHDGIYDLLVGGKIDGKHALRLKDVGLCKNIQLALLSVAQWEPRRIDYSELVGSG